MKTEIKQTHTPTPSLEDAISTVEAYLASNKLTRALLRGIRESNAIPEEYEKKVNEVLAKTEGEEFSSAFIVKAVNSHEAMLKALKQVIEDDTYGKSDETFGIFSATLAKVKRAIARAEGNV